MATFMLTSVLNDSSGFVKSDSDLKLTQSLRVTWLPHDNRGLPDLFVAPSVLLQDPQGVVSPLTFAVELHSPCQTIVLHLAASEVRKFDRSREQRKSKDKK